jgi:MoxR-like ATPase
MEQVISDLQKKHGIAGRAEELSSSLLAAQAGKHLLLEGGVGVGKTTIAVAVAGQLGRSYVRIDGDERYTEQKLAGWFDPPLVLSRGYTRESFIPGPLAVTMGEGSVLLINELNRMPEGTQNVLLSAMDEKTMYIPKYGRVDAADGFMLIATQNPDEYIGTSQLSEALRDRFICISLNYQSEEEEKRIVRLRSRCTDERIIDVAVTLTRLTRIDREVRRGSSIRGAIDLADIYSTAYGTFSGDGERWLRCAALAYTTKIELHDHSEARFAELLKRLVPQALEIRSAGGTAPVPGGEKSVVDFDVREAREKKK